MSDLNLSDVQIQSQDQLFVVCFPLVLSAWGSRGGGLYSSIVFQAVLLGQNYQ